MTIIRRTIVILIVLAVAFFIYRGINPTGADALLVRIKVISGRFFGSGNILLGTGVSTTGQNVSGDSIDSGVLDTSRRSEIFSGMESSGSGMESSGDELILGDITSSSTGTLLTGQRMTGTTSPIVTPSTVIKKTSPTTTTTTSKGLSTKDRSDIEKLLHLFQ